MVRVAWTGHRPYYFRDPPAVERKVREVAASLKSEFGPALEFLVGGQRGVDNWAALAALSLCIPYRLILPLPLPVFTRDWAQEDVAVLAKVWELAAARQVVDESGETGPDAHDRRNDLLASEADLVVAVWTGLKGGGTYYTIRKAEALGKPVRYLMVEGSGKPVQWDQRGI